MMKKIGLIISVLTIGCFLANGAFANATSQNVKHAKDHYHPKGKAPTEHTIKILEAAKADLPFSDTLDFEEANKGFIAGPLSPKIMADAGHVAWDHEAYNFIDEKDEYSSVHPSALRQAKLVNRTGLFAVVPDKIYQVRNFDLSNITFVRGKICPGSKRVVRCKPGRNPCFGSCLFT
jgi:alkyl sulfatase BDS1-like metallo-beta-lactamase superfamily hydrolase